MPGLRAEAQPRAPKFLQNLGLEWFFRLTKEPKRLWRRYLDVVPRALVIMARTALAQRTKTRT